MSTTVVTVVEEDDHVALLDGTVHVGVDQRFHEFVRVLVVLAVAVVAALYALHHVGACASLALDELVVGHLDAVPALVAVHGVEAADDAGHGGAALLAVCHQAFDEALTALGVRVAAVHEAVNEGAAADAIFVGDVDEFEQVVQRGVYAAVAGQAHEVEALALTLGIFVGADDFRIFEDAAVGTGAVDLHQVLIDDASGTDIEVSHLRVAHLSVGQTHVFAAGQQLGMGVGGRELVDEGCGGLEDDVALAVRADAPSVQNDEQCFVCHNVSILM